MGSCRVTRRSQPLPSDTLGWGLERLKVGRTYVYLWLTHVVVWQKPTQHCKAVILQSKINLKNVKKTIILFAIKLPLCFWLKTK